MISPSENISIHEKSVKNWQHKSKELDNNKAKEQPLLKSQVCQSTRYNFHLFRLAKQRVNLGTLQ